MSTPDDDRPAGESAAMAGAAEASDEPETGLLHLEVARIKAYDGNPRRHENPQYERIKASIRAEGMDQVLIVTRRPGDDGYMLHAGGNTRLKVLQELHAETGEERFRVAACVFRAWTCEADVLLAHLKENDLRGELSFLDKALAVREARRLIEAQAGEGAITQASLAETLRERGYGVSQSVISQMAYATDTLLALLPVVLESGMGKPQVERIRSLERVTRALWLERSVDTEAEFDTVFAALCRRYDGPDWDIANLRRALEAEIAERAEISIHFASIELDLRLAGQKSDDLLAPWPAAATDAAIEAAEPGDGVKRGDVDPAGASAPSASTLDEHASGGTCPADRDETSGTTAATIAIADVEPAEQAQPSNAMVDAVLDAALPEPTDLRSLRARAWTLASRLAQRNGLGELIEPLSRTGLGFVLRDVPDPALVDRLDEDTLAQISMLWWQLAACAELTVAPVAELLPALADASVLRRALEEQDAGLLFDSVWTLDPGHTGYRLWRRLDDRDWTDLLSLMDTYRKLHRAAEQTGTPLWG